MNFACIFVYHRIGQYSFALFESCEICFSAAGYYNRFGPIIYTCVYFRIKFELWRAKLGLR